MAQEFKTGVGRIVWGNPAKPQIKKYQDGPDKGKPVLKDGQPVHQWAFGVAFPKAEFQAAIYPYMHAEMSTGFPNGAPPKFAWKFVDGDGIDSNGQPFAAREGYAGCYVLTVATEAFAPPIYKYQNGSYAQLPADGIKTGDYVVCAIKTVLNVPADRTRVPSLYVNPVAIEHVGYGKEIQNGPDAAKLFGGATYQLPPGASAQPVAPSGGLGMPGTVPQPGMMAAPQMQQSVAMPGMVAPVQPVMQAQMPAPAHDFVQNAGMQMPAVMPGMVAPQIPGAVAPTQPTMPGMMPGMVMPGNG